MKALLLSATVLFVLWIILVFEVHVPIWAVYLLGVIILLLLFAWFISLFRNGPRSGGRRRAL